MREIKFRVWEYRHQRTKGKGWQDSKFIWQMNYSPMLEGGETMCYGSSVDLNNALKNGGDEDDGIINPSIFMQYTGLKDKNGKEIYEGDIVMDGVDRYIVEFREGGFNLAGIEDFTHDIYIWLRIGSIEIIGNIYENPELLSNLKQTER